MSSCSFSTFLTVDSLNHLNIFETRKLKLKVAKNKQILNFSNKKMNFKFSKNQNIETCEKHWKMLKTWKNIEKFNQFCKTIKIDEKHWKVWKILTNFEQFLINLEIFECWLRKLLEIKVLKSCQTSSKAFLQNNKVAASKKLLRKKYLSCPISLFATRFPWKQAAPNWKQRTACSLKWFWTSTLALIISIDFDSQSSLASIKNKSVYSDVPARDQLYLWTAYNCTQTEY